MNSTFDFIVIGSGSAGGVLAARLSENGKYTVACVEAGTHGANFIWTRPPLASGFMIEDPRVNWCQYSQPNDSHGNRPIYVPRGKILGGTSAINGMIYNRGQRLDYENWARMGCAGWAYEDVLPYFKKIESTDIGEDRFRGRNGPMKVSLAHKTSPFYDLFFESARSVGLPANPDYSGETQHGVAMAQQTIHRGLRQSVATQYLKPAAGRRNLTVLSGAHVTALRFEGKRCTGIRFRRNGATQELRAAREVILSAGTIASPQLLELSGIGNPAVLAKHGIPLVHPLPGVGENLRDHFGPTLQWKFSRPGISLAPRGRGLALIVEVARLLLFRSGFISQGLATLRVFAKSHAGVEQSDMALLVNPFLVEIQGKKRVMSRTDGFYISTQVQRPESSGRVHIRTTDPFDAPAIDYRFLETEKDCRTIIAAVRLARRIVAAPPLATVVSEEMRPGADIESDEAILEFARNTGTTTYHPVGTCRMGTDATSVVDPRLRVHGLEGLRVIDASVMPMIISGNTSIPTIMIGERGADMILADAAVAAPRT